MGAPTSLEWGLISGSLGITMAGDGKRRKALMSAVPRDMSV